MISQEPLGESAGQLANVPGPLGVAGLDAFLGFVSGLEVSLSRMGNLLGCGGGVHRKERPLQGLAIGHCG